jgi:dTDP-4-amino-4,6-dideoxygalactose transaminase
MDEYSAAECLDEIDLMEPWNERRRRIAARFDAALAETGLRAPYVAPGRTHTYFSYMVKSPSVATREDFEFHLQSAGIEIDQPYTVVPDQQMYRTRRLPSRVDSADEARTIAQLLTPVPCYPELSEPQVEWIETALSSFR